MVLLSHVRYPLYSKHSEALADVEKVNDPVGQLVMIWGVIEGICQHGVMADCSFPCDEVFPLFKNKLLAVAKKIQAEGLDQPASAEALVVARDIVARIRAGDVRYVTGDSGHNFCAEDLGDWAGVLTEFEATVNQPPSAEEVAAHKKAVAEKASSVAQADLEAAEVEVEQLQKKLQAAQKKRKTAQTKAEKARKAVEALTSEERPAKRAKLAKKN